MTDTSTSDLDLLAEFVSTLSMYLGVLALGLAAGFHLSLHWTQSVVFVTNRIPLKEQAGEVYPVLVRMQAWSNTAAYAAAGLLLIGAVVHRRKMLLDWYREVE